MRLIRLGATVAVAFLALVTEVRAEPITPAQSK